MLHARWGRFEQARRLLSEASRHNPRLRRLVGPLADAGILDRDDVTRLTSPECTGPDAVSAPLVEG
ncbi:hypothetical protein C1Y40_05446 [Mycobacterium talmoniae]|uniref:Uncharacterized protein n=1 Tax=Mycobacterium talmoniae TaxID=1858794 RepID=A0A2S8BCM9_9MYCO|nr:hypothetical protein C1Y40_05446 [Mycobacterium talmoniae]